jgi:hypothetical protein
VGIAAFRLSPQDCDMIAIARIFRAVIDRRMAPEEAMAELSILVPAMPFSNGFFHGAEGLRFLRRAGQMEGPMPGEQAQK